MSRIFSNQTAFPSFLINIGVIVILFSMPIKADAISYDNDISLDFVWEAASGDVDHYNVYVSTDSGDYVLDGITSETSYTVTGSDGHTYRVKVAAVDAAGNVGPMSEESAPVTVFLGPPTYANITVFLEGPYESDKIMRTELTIPTISPYADARGVKTVPANAVDWVYVEIRSDETTTVRGKSMFLLSNGSIVDRDGEKRANFYDLPTGDYYLVIRHRNHLAIMSKSPVSFVQSGDSQVDLTAKDNVFSEANAVKELEADPDIYGMYAGDANGDGRIRSSDKNDYWRPQLLTSGYKSGDFNLDGKVRSSDKNDYWRPNVLMSTQVP